MMRSGQSDPVKRDRNQGTEVGDKDRVERWGTERQGERETERGTDFETEGRGQG